MRVGQTLEAAAASLGIDANKMAKGSSLGEGRSVAINPGATRRSKKAQRTGKTEYGKGTKCKVTPAERVKAYPGHTLTVDAGDLVCECCGYTFANTVKQTVKQHVKDSETHKTRLKEFQASKTRYERPLFVVRGCMCVLCVGVVPRCCTRVYCMSNAGAGD